MDEEFYIEHGNSLINENKNLKLRLQKMTERLTPILSFTDFCNVLLKVTDIEEITDIIIQYYKRVVFSEDVEFIRKSYQEDTYAYYKILSTNMHKEKIRRSNIGRKGFFLFCKKVHKGIEGKPFIAIPIKYEGENIAALKINNIKEQDYENLDTRMLELYSLPAGLAIKNSLLNKQSHEEKKIIMKQNQHIQEDLVYAQKVQKCIMKSGEVDFGDYKIYRNYIPAYYLGGDLYDIIKLDEHTTLFYLADISGHGVASSLLSIYLKETIKFIVDDIKTDFHNFKKNLMPSYILKKIQKKFKTFNFDSSMYAGMMLGILDTKDNSIILSNAGHNVEPIHIKHEYNEMVTYEIKGMPINNWFDESFEAEYEDINIYIHKNDSIILLSDGTIEAMDSNRNALGMDRIKSLLMENKECSFFKQFNKIVDIIYDFKKSSKIDDDITFLGIRRMDGEGDLWTEEF